MDEAIHKEHNNVAWHQRLEQSMLLCNGSQPMGHDALGGVTYQITCLLDIYIKIHHSSKITVMK